MVSKSRASSYAVWIDGASCQDIINHTDLTWSVIDSSAHTSAVFIAGRDETHWTAQEFESPPWSDENCQQLALLIQWYLPVNMRCVELVEVTGVAGDARDHISGGERGGVAGVARIG